MKIKIVTDSTADLTNEIIERYSISVLPLKIYLNGMTYTDRVDITPQDFIEKMKQSEELPKSSQPSVGEFLELYDRLAKESDEIISIHVAGALSGTVQTARLAAEQSKGKVTVVDSEFISNALAYQVLEAAQMAEKGSKIEEILERLAHVRKNTKLYVLLSTLENLVKGGRIGKGTGLIGSLLKIKPIAALENGVYTPIKVVRSYAQAVKQLANRFKDEIEGKKIKSINIVHADGMNLALQLKEKLQETIGNIELKIEETTPIISIHTGPGAIGFMFYTE